MSIQDNIQAAAAGDHRAFASMVEQYREMIWRVSLRMLGDPAEAEDAVQEIFIRAWMTLPGYDSRYSPKTGPQNNRAMKTRIKLPFRKITGIVLTASAAITLLPSCITYYTVIPEINPDGSMTRTVYAEADSACLADDLSSHPFLFEPGEHWQTGRMAEPRTWWFLDDSATMNFYARGKFLPSDTSYREPRHLRNMLNFPTSGPANIGTRNGESSSTPTATPVPFRA